MGCEQTIKHRAISPCAGVAECSGLWLLCCFFCAFRTKPSLLPIPSLVKVRARSLHPGSHFSGGLTVTALSLLCPGPSWGPWTLAHLSGCPLQLSTALPTMLLLLLLSLNSGEFAFGFNNKFQLCILFRARPMTKAECRGKAKPVACCSTHLFSEISLSC